MEKTTPASGNIARESDTKRIWASESANKVISDRQRTQQTRVVLKKAPWMQLWKSFTRGNVAVGICYSLDPDKCHILDVRSRWMSFGRCKRLWEFECTQSLVFDRETDSTKCWVHGKCSERDCIFSTHLLQCSIFIYSKQTNKKV